MDLDMQNIEETAACSNGNNTSRLRLLSVLLGTMIALVVADGLISQYLIVNGLAREGNPLLQIWIHDELFLGLKLAGAFFAALAIRIIHKNRPNLSFSITLCFVVFYTGLVFWSLIIFWGSHV